MKLAGRHSLKILYQAACCAHDCGASSLDLLFHRSRASQPRLIAARQRPIHGTLQRTVSKPPSDSAAHPKECWPRYRAKAADRIDHWHRDSGTGWKFQCSERIGRWRLSRYEDTLKND